MNPLSLDCQEMVASLDTKIQMLMVALCSGNTANAAEDAAKTWYQRGQVNALKEFKKLIKED